MSGEPGLPHWIWIKWKENAVAALSEAHEERPSPQETRDSRKRIEELRRDLRRKEKVLVLSKQLQAILQRNGEDGRLSWKIAR